MDNHNIPASNDEAARFPTKNDTADRMADDAAVNFAHQVSDWSKDNLTRFDNDGNKRVNFGELDLGKRTSHNADDNTALNYLQEHYNEIQKHSQNRFLF